MTPLLYMTIRQARNVTFRGLTFSRPVVFRVCSGDVAISGEDGRLRVTEGSIGVLGPDRPLAVSYHPPANGAFEAEVLLTSPGADDMIGGTPWAAASDRRTNDAFDKAKACLTDPTLPLALKDHAVREVRLWLAERGIGTGHAISGSQTEALRRMFAADPSFNWSAGEAALRMGLTSSALRRRLSAEDTSFMRLLSETRLCLALSALQSSDRSVSEVASHVGYACPSRFTARFRDRFGLTPSAVRSEVPGEMADAQGTGAARVPA